MPHNVRRFARRVQWLARAAVPRLGWSRADGGGVAAISGKASTTVPPDARFDAAHRHLLADRDNQFDLPQYTPPQIPSWLRPLFDTLGQAWPIVRIGLLAALAIGVAVLALVAWRVWQARRRGTVVADEPPWRPEAGPARALLAEADRLAATGEFAAAAHLVLLRSVEHIAARRPGTLGPALTSRDIARLGALPADVARAFALIGAVVEAGIFGARPVEAAAWARCRAAYAAVALPTAWA